jgi:hypothetical protein
MHENTQATWKDRDDTKDFTLVTVLII